MIIESTNRSDRSRSVGLRAADIAARRVSQLPVAQRVKVDGSDKLKQGGHTGVDNWPWPGGHST
jgi:hypothetical protein